MAGVVFAVGGTTGSLGRFGSAISVGAGAAIPPGQYFVDGAWSLVSPDGTHAMPAGFCQSDGTNATATGAIHAVPLGAGHAPVWPWSIPWPLPGHG